MAISPNKWIKKPVDEKKVIRQMLKNIFKENKLTWAEMARQHECSKGALQRSIESKLAVSNDFLNKYGLEVVVKNIEK